MTPNMDSFHAVFTKQKIGKGMLLPSFILIKKFLSEVSFINIDGVPKSRWNIKAIIIFSLKFTHSETFRHLLGLICKEPRAQQSAMVFELLLPCPLHLVPTFIAIQIDFIFTDITYQQHSFPFCLFVLHEPLIILLLSIVVLSSANSIACKCLDSIKGQFL